MNGRSVIEGGGRVIQETRLDNVETGETGGLRSKRARTHYSAITETGPVPRRIRDAGSPRSASARLGAAGGRGGGTGSDSSHSVGYAEYDAGVLTRRERSSDYSKPRTRGGDPTQ